MIFSSLAVLDTLEYFPFLSIQLPELLGGRTGEIIAVYYCRVFPPGDTGFPSTNGSRSKNLLRYETGEGIVTSYWGDYLQSPVLDFKTSPSDYPRFF